jgi:hypothetical protein
MVSHLAFIVQIISQFLFVDPAPIIFGLPTPEMNWAPLVDTTMPENLRLPMFGQWVSSYFDNGDYSKRDLNTLAYVLPSTDKVPAIFSPGLSHTATYGQEAGLDLPLLFFFAVQLKATFRKAFGGPETISLFPNLKTTFICADRSPSFGLAGLWAAQDDLKEGNLGNDVKFKVVKGANHFVRPSRYQSNPNSALNCLFFFFFFFFSVALGGSEPSFGNFHSRRIIEYLYSRGLFNRN